MAGQRAEVDVDTMLSMCVSATVTEVNDLLEIITPDEVTPAEMVALLAILRAVAARRGRGGPPPQTPNPQPRSKRSPLVRIA